MTQQTMYIGLANSPVTELSAAIDNIQTTISLVDASKLPAAPNIATIGSDETAETVLYTGKTGNDLTGVTRGFEGVAKSWGVGSKVARNFTAYDHASFKGNIEDHETRIVAHLAEAVTAVNAVEGHNADPSGVTDTITQLTSAATAAAGKTLFIQPGSYQIGSTLVIPDNTTVFAYGARIFNTTAHITLLSLGNNVKIYGLELQGVGNASAVSTGIGIAMKGADSSSYKDTAIIEDCYIHDVGFYGIHLEFAKNVIIRCPRIEHIGYAGIMGISATNVNVDGGHIKDVAPGTTQCYGVAFTRTSLTNSLVTYPRSKDCTVSNMLLEDIPLYEALDTHGGENIAFIRNTIRNCGRGISITSSHLSGVIDHAAKECKAIGNTVYGSGGGFGIQIIGEKTAEYNMGAIIEGNNLYQSGMQTTTTGAIYAYDTIGMVIKGNNLYQCYGGGAIVINNDNQGFVAEGNTIVDPQDSTLTYAAGIVILGNDNVGTINGNTFLRINDSLNTYVSERGIYIAGASNNLVMIGDNYNNFVIELSGITLSNSLFGKFGGTGVNVYCGINSPEGVVTAGVGSLFIRTNGSVGATLYVKQSGTGNTGWTASNVLASGTTANRPTSVPVGTPYFDMTLGKPIWLKTAPSTWADATGTTV